jgi:hypothetical protein
MTESDDLHEHSLSRDNADDVGSSDSDYISLTPQAQRRSMTTAVVHISVNNDSEESDDELNESDSDSRISDFDDSDSECWKEYTE